jgi:HEAT repeat protein
MLRSDKAEQRNEAERKLKDLGKAALPELNNAARSGDRELSERSRRLLKVIPVRIMLTANLLAEIPGIDERLGLGDEHVWTTVFLDIADRLTVEQDPPKTAGEATKDQSVNQRVKKLWKETPEKGKVLPLKSEDVRVLVLPAIRGAKAPEERGKVFQVITERNLHSFVPDLRSLWKEGDEDLRCRIIAAVSALRATSALVELRSALGDGSPEVRASATRALGIVGGPEVIRDLLAMLGDPSAAVREMAVVSLTLRDAKEGIPGITRMLSDSNAGVRGFAALALGRLEAKSSVPELIKSLEDPDEQVRLFAVDALGGLNAKEAAPALTKLLADRSRWVRRSAYTALPGLKGKDAVPDLERGLNDGDFEIQRAALEGLWRLRGREAVPHFQKLLSVSDPGLRLLVPSRRPRYTYTLRGSRILATKGVSFG